MCIEFALMSKSRNIASTLSVHTAGRCKQHLHFFSENFQNISEPLHIVSIFGIIIGKAFEYV